MIRIDWELLTFFLIHTFTHTHTMFTCINSCASSDLQTHNTEINTCLHDTCIHTQTGDLCSLLVSFPQSQELATMSQGPRCLAHPETQVTSADWEVTHSGRGCGGAGLRSRVGGSREAQIKWFNLLGTKEWALFEPLSSFYKLAL